MEEPAADQRPLKQAIRSAMYGGGILLGLAQVAGFLILSALLKILAPGDFGLLGMILPLLLGVRMVAALGPGVAVVQRERLTDEQLSTLFWTIQALGLGGTLLIGALAPVLAWYNRTPELTILTLSLAGTSLAFSLGAQHQALLQRDLQHTSLAAISLAGQIAGGIVGIALAWAGWGVWSLVVMHYVEPLVITALVWMRVPFRPGPPRWAAGAGELVHFGGRFTLASIVLYVAQQMDKVLLGAVSGEVALGLFSQAYFLANKVVFVVTGSLSSIILPALSRARLQPEMFGKLITAFFRMIAGILFPAAAGLAIVAPDVILVLADKRWSESGALLRIMSLAIVAQAFFNIAGTLMTAAGRVERLAASSWIVLVVFAASAAIALAVGRGMGDVPMAMAVAYTVTMTVVLFVPYLAWTLYVIGVHPSVLWEACWRPMLSTLGMSAVVIACRYLLLTYAPDMSPLLRLAVQVAAGIGANSIFAMSELRWLWSHWRQFRGLPAAQTTE